MNVFIDVINRIADKYKNEDHARTKVQNVYVQNLYLYHSTLYLFIMQVCSLNCIDKDIVNFGYKSAKFSSCDKIQTFNARPMDTAVDAVNYTIFKFTNVLLSYIL